MFVDEIDLNIGEVILKLQYGELLEVNLDASEQNSVEKKEKLIKYFTKFYHHHFGICWSLDFNAVGLNPVEPEELYIQLQVSK